MEKSKVYFTKEITPESLIKMYETLGVELKGKVAVKLSTGEPGGHHFLNPNLIKDLVIDGYQKEVLTLNQLDEGMIDGIKIKYVIDWLLENG